MPVAERAQRLVVLQVAHVMPDPGAAALGERERVLELGAAREQAAARSRPAAGSSRARNRASAAAPAGGPRPTRDDGVVGARLDRPVVEQEQVRDVRQPLAGVLVAVRDRLVGDVAAGQHERRAGVGQQQVMERRVGQHHAELRRPRRGGGRHAGAGAPAERARSAVARSSSSCSSAADGSTSSRAAARSGAISANGLSSRCLRARSSATAASSSARHARWKPPTPFTATIAPASSAPAAASTASRASGSATAPPPA